MAISWNAIPVIHGFVTAYHPTTMGSPTRSTVHPPTLSFPAAPSGVFCRKFAISPTILQPRNREKGKIRLESVSSLPRSVMMIISSSCSTAFLLQVVQRSWKPTPPTQGWYLHKLPVDPCIGLSASHHALPFLRPRQTFKTPVCQHCHEPDVLCERSSHHPSLIVRRCTEYEQR